MDLQRRQALGGELQCIPRGSAIPDERAVRPADARLAAYNRRTGKPLLVLAFGFLVVYAIPILWPRASSGLLLICEAVSYLIWVVFVADLVIRVYLAEHRSAYIGQHPVDLLVVALPALRPLRILRVFTAGQVILTRGKEFTIGRTFAQPEPATTRRWPAFSRTCGPKNGQALYRERGAAAAISTMIMENQLAADLGVEFVNRADGHGREIKGVSQKLMDEFSSRARKDIEPGLVPLIEAYRDRYGHDPDEHALWAMGQYVSRDRREPKRDTDPAQPVRAWARRAREKAAWPQRPSTPAW